MWFRKSNGIDEAEEAVRSAEKVVEEVKLKTPEVKRLNRALHHKRVQNHFSEQITELFTRG